MARNPDRQRIVLIAAAAALAGALVTATVTKAPAQLAGEYQVVITNLDTGSQHPWQRHTFPGQRQCDAVLGNANAVFRAVADPDPKVIPEDFNGPSQELNQSMTAVIFYLLQNTGKLPNLSISCELKGDPA